MTMEGIVNLILNSSVSIVVIAYFMFRDYKFIQQVNVNIQKLVDIIASMNANVENVKKEVKKNGY